MVTDEVAESEGFITWIVQDLRSLHEKHAGFAEFSPPFYMPETGECEWQLELTPSYQYEKYFAPQDQDMNIPCSSKQKFKHIELRLRLIKPDQIDKTFQKPFSIVIKCYLQTALDRCFSVFYNRESFSGINSSWCSTAMDCQQLLPMLNGGLLKIRVKLEYIFNAICKVPTHKIPLEIHEAFRKMRKENVLTDISLTAVNRKVINVHRCILAIRTHQFLQSCEPVENERDGGCPHQIQTDLSYTALNEFVDYIYNGTISPSLSISIAYELFQVAAKYDLANLRNLCENILVLSLTVSNVVEILLFADNYKILCLKRRALEFISTNREQFLEEDSFLLVQSPHLLQEILDYTATCDYEQCQLE